MHFMDVVDDELLAKTKDDDEEEESAPGAKVEAPQECCRFFSHLCLRGLITKSKRH